MLRIFSIFLLVFGPMAGLHGQAPPAEPEGKGYCEDFDLCLSASAYAGMGTVTCPHEEVVIRAYATRCPDSEDGMLIANVSGGVPPYKIEWSNGATGTRIEGLAPGHYAVTVTDGDGCRIVRETQLSAPPTPRINWTIESEFPGRRRDQGAKTIRVTLDLTEACFRFQWDGQPGTDSPILENAAPGRHVIRIEDHNGCVYEEEILVK